MTASVPVRPHALAATQALLAAPGFYGDAHIDADGTATYPFPLSSGQALLWRCVAAVNGEGELPEWADLRAGLDADNYAAVVSVLRAGQVAS